MRRLVFLSLLVLSACATTDERPAFNSKAADLNAQLGDGYAQQGRYQRSLEKYTKAIIFNPQLEDAYLGAIKVASLSGDRTLATEFLDKFLAAMPERPTPYESYAAFHCRAGDFLAAEKKLLSALTAEVYSQQTDVYNSMTACARDVARFDLAAVYNDHAKQLAPTNKEVLLQAALNEHTQNRPQKTLAALEEYYGNGGVDAQWLQLALTLANTLGDQGAASVWQKRLKTLYPLMNVQ